MIGSSNIFVEDMSDLIRDPFNACSVFLRVFHLALTPLDHTVLTSASFPQYPYKLLLAATQSHTVLHDIRLCRYLVGIGFFHSSGTPLSLDDYWSSPMSCISAGFVRLLFEASSSYSYLHESLRLPVSQHHATTAALSGTDVILRPCLPAVVRHHPHVIVDRKLYTIINGYNRSMSSADVVPNTELIPSKCLICRYIQIKYSLPLSAV